MTPATREWLRKSQADLRSAQRLALAKPTDHDIVCFHCQQAVEKLLKGLLCEQSIPFPKTHNLVLLIELIAPIDPALVPLKSIAIRLNRYAVDFRYPGVRADKAKSRSALAAAERFRVCIRKGLNLRP